MTVKTGQAWAGLFVTLDATGALAAGTPSGVLYVDGVADAATVTITGSNPYKFSVTLPSLTAGQRVDMYITATISTIATASVVASEQADTSLLSDGVTVSNIATDALTAAAVKADAVTKIQAGLALEATLTAMKGAGWTDETLKAIHDLLEIAAAVLAGKVSGGGTTTITFRDITDTINKIVATVDENGNRTDVTIT